MKIFFALALLCSTLSSPPPAFSQITEAEILALIAANDLVLARERVQETRRSSPTSALAAYYSAALEEDADAAASAFLDFIKRFEESPYHERALYRLGQYYFARGKYDRSRQYFVELANQPSGAPLVSEARYHAAKALLLSGDLPGAKAELENVARQFPGTGIAKFAQEDLQQEGLQALPSTPPPRLAEKTSPNKAATAAGPSKEEGTVALQTPSAAKNEEPEVIHKTPSVSNPLPRKADAPPATAERKSAAQTTVPSRKEERKAEPAPKKIAPNKPKPKITAPYAVQIGAYLQRVNAEDQKKRYAQAGYKTEVVEKQEGKRTYYAVWVGELTTREQAYALVEELKKKFKVRAHTVRRDE